MHLNILGPPSGGTRVGRRPIEPEAVSVEHWGQPFPFKSAFNDPAKDIHTYEALKGNPKKGIEPTMWPVPDDHDSSDRMAAHKLIHSRGIPIGIIYQRDDVPSLDERVEEMQGRVKTKTVDQLLESYRL